mgnify:CR=1 FL=1
MSLIPGLGLAKGVVPRGTYKDAVNNDVDIPTITILDQARPPDLKTRPKRGPGLPYFDDATDAFKTAPPCRKATPIPVGTGGTAITEAVVRVDAVVDEHPGHYTVRPATPGGNPPALHRKPVSDGSGTSGLEGTDACPWETK